MRFLSTLFLLLVAGCATMPASLTAPAPLASSTPKAPTYIKSSNSVGTVTYDSVSQLQPDAMIVVQLVGTDADGAFVALGLSRVSAAGAQAPFSFDIPYSSGQVPTVQKFLQIYAEILDGLRNPRWSASAPLQGDIVPSRYDLFLQPARLTQSDG